MKKYFIMPLLIISAYVISALVMPRPVQTQHSIFGKMGSTGPTGPRGVTGSIGPTGATGSGGSFDPSADETITGTWNFTKIVDGLAYSILSNPFVSLSPDEVQSTQTFLFGRQNGMGNGAYLLFLLGDDTQQSNYITTFLNPLLTSTGAEPTWIQDGRGSFLLSNFYDYGASSAVIETYVDNNAGSIGTLTNHPIGIFTNFGSYQTFFNTDGSFRNIGPILSDDLKTTGSASGKKVVCVDTTTGQLYASSTGTDCSN